MISIWNGGRWREIHYFAEPLLPDVVEFRDDGQPILVGFSSFQHVVHLPWRWLSTIPPHLAGEEPLGCPAADWQRDISRWKTLKAAVSSFQKRLAAALPNNDNEAQQ